MSSKRNRKSALTLLEGGEEILQSSLQVKLVSEITEMSVLIIHAALFPMACQKQDAPPCYNYCCVNDPDLIKVHTLPIIL